jgi:hypothetical protein
LSRFRKTGQAQFRQAKCNTVSTFSAVLRDKNCNFYVKLIGEGSLRRTEELGCLVIMTEARTSELYKIADELIQKGYGEKK